MDSIQRTPHLIIIYQQKNQHMSEKDNRDITQNVQQEGHRPGYTNDTLNKSHTYPKTIISNLTPTQLQQGNTAPTQINYRGTT